LESSGTPAPDVEARIHKAAAKLLEIGLSNVEFPKFQREGTTVRYTFGHVGRDNDESREHDILAELIRRDAELQALRKVLAGNYADADFWKVPLADAEDALREHMTEANLGVESEGTVKSIRDTMDTLHAVLQARLTAYLQARSLEAESIPERGLGGQAFDVKVTTDPPGARVEYIRLDMALRQTVLTDAEHPGGRRFPDQLVYRELVPNPAKLRGPYVFKVTTPAKTKYFPRVDIVSGGLHVLPIK
jgi:hypothetical protein